jgi:Cu(I)/Ag(I) efflux system membrane protein CusA/SilA
MIEKLVEYSIRNRFIILLLCAALIVWGIYATIHTPIDAIPDLSENQVIVFTDWPGRSPREIEDQITYPLSLRLQGLAGIKTIRASSEFNFSMITIIFDDNVNYYFARERVLERLVQASAYLPTGVVPYLAPDATALGQIYWYTVEPSPSHPLDPGRLWALNKFYIVPQLNSVAGVAEVAPVGGAPLEYQIEVRPEQLRAYGLTMGELITAVSRSNLPAPGGVVHKNNAEYVVRGIGWIQDKSDIENIVVQEVNGIPIYVKTLARVHVGPQYRRGVFEKDGIEVVGGVVLMRHGENPLTVTTRIQQKIQQLQAGLPEGVHIVPAYDRTRLIRGAIHTLTEVLWHEMVIAGLAILIILAHVGSVFVICVTLPLSVLFSFLLMSVLRHLGIVDIQANIMSLAGITISIGVLADQAIVMTENATHYLKKHFGDQRVTGDTRGIIEQACRLVARPIFFAVMIMLLSFVPVFLLTGREGKYFHPLAFTKSFALLGVALLSVTVVPALLPTCLRGRLRSEQQNWLVRSFIQVYRPLLAWALPRWNLVMWCFAALLIVAAGIFPVQALLGLGASLPAWHTTFVLIFAVVTLLVVSCTDGVWQRLLSLASLVLLALWAYHLPKIGVSFMPSLDEGTLLDMPVTVPRASITEVINDLKARDALLRGFPEVESVIGKAGRAETATDPAPLEMVETFVNFRPRELWPKRVLRFTDAQRQTRAVLRALEEQLYVVSAASRDDRDHLINEATQRALERFDETMRELALRRYLEFEAELGRTLVRLVVTQTFEQIRWPETSMPPSLEEIQPLIEDCIHKFAVDEGPQLARHPTVSSIHRIVRYFLEGLATRYALTHAEKLWEHSPHRWNRVWAAVTGWLGDSPQTLELTVLASVEKHRRQAWLECVRRVNSELFDYGTATYTWYALEELIVGADQLGWIQEAPHHQQARRMVQAVRNTRRERAGDPEVLQQLSQLRAELEAPFRKHVLFWQRQGGPKGDLVDDEMGRVLQVPGWSNIFTQPIINRIEMLSTGVRTDIGIKVFGPDLPTIERVGKQIEEVIKPLRGARDVIAAPIMGKGYLEITIDRARAARYGITVEDVMTEIETALGGRVVTQTIENRDRFPVRIRYVRAQREDEQTVRRLLLSGSVRSVRELQVLDPSAAERTSVAQSHQAAPLHAATPPPLIPLTAVADVRLVEGPAVIKSENGRLLNYVTLNVRGRDAIGFVEEARRVVAQQVQLPEGVHIEWTGEFEHQQRAARTLQIAFPLVILIIFCILYWTYHDLADAALVLLTVPEALAGGAFFLYLFPKIMHGWHAPPYDFSVAVWVGFIACFGMATETGIIMLVYLREAIQRRGGLEKIASLEELREVVLEGAVQRLRPKLLTEGVAIVGIFPMVFASGVGAEVLAPMALPVLGGLLIADEVVDVFLPVRFYWIRRRRWLQLHSCATPNKN